MVVRMPNAQSIRTTKAEMTTLGGIADVTDMN